MSHLHPNSWEEAETYDHDHIPLVASGSMSWRLIALEPEVCGIRRLMIVSLLGGLLAVLAGVAYAQHHSHPHRGHTTSSPDTRILVNFPAELTEHTLANMRDHLLALQEINTSMGDGRYEDAAKIAEARLGMSSLGLHGTHEVSKYMPQGMKDAGSSMHRAASRFAIAAQNAAVTGDLKPTFTALADLMSGCNGCHAGYKLR